MFLWLYTCNSYYYYFNATIAFACSLIFAHCSTKTKLWFISLFFCFIFFSWTFLIVVQRKTINNPQFGLIFISFRCLKGTLKYNKTTFNAKFPSSASINDLQWRDRVCECWREIVHITKATYGSFKVTTSVFVFLMTSSRLDPRFSQHRLSFTHSRQQHSCNSEYTCYQ